MRIVGRFGQAMLVITMAAVGGCSGGGASGPTGNGGGGSGAGSAGSAGAQAGAGGGAGGAGGSVTDAGVDVPMAPAEPLCPKNAPIVAGSTPLPDGVEVVSSATDVERIAVTDTYAYWTNETKIFRAPVSGGGGETVILDRTASRNHIEGLAVTDDFVYYSDSGINNALGVSRLPADGSAAPVTVIAGNSYEYVVVADGYVYSNDLGSNEIVRAPVTGGARTVLADDMLPSGFTVAAGYLWVMHPYVNAVDNVNLLRIPVGNVAPSPDAGVIGDGGINVPPGAEKVAPVHNYHPTGVTADATHIYYDDENRVMRVPIAGGTPNQVYKAPDTSGFIGPETRWMGVVVGYAGSVYWAPESSGCEPLIKSSGDGTTHTPYVQKINGPWGIAVNATHVYLLVRGQVLRVPRPQ